MVRYSIILFQIIALSMVGHFSPAHSETVFNVLDPNQVNTICDQYQYYDGNQQLSPAGYALCQAAVKNLRCGSVFQTSTDTACGDLAANFRSLTGLEPPWLITCPCGALDSWPSLVQASSAICLVSIKYSDSGGRLIHARSETSVSLSNFALTAPIAGPENISIQGAEWVFGLQFGISPDSCFSDTDGLSSDDGIPLDLLARLLELASSGQIGTALEYHACQRHLLDLVELHNETCRVVEDFPDSE